MYAFLFNTSIPHTRKKSYSEFCSSGRRANIKAYILHLLESYPSGLSCRQISDISSIWVQSLTNPLKTLEESGQIKIAGYRRSQVSNRVVQIYSLNKVK